MNKIIALGTIIAPLMLITTAVHAGVATPTSTADCLKLLDTLASKADSNKISEDVEKKLEPLAEKLTQNCEAGKFPAAVKLYQQIEQAMPTR